MRSPEAKDSSIAERITLIRLRYILVAVYFQR